ADPERLTCLLDTEQQLGVPWMSARLVHAPRVSHVQGRRRPIPANPINPDGVTRKGIQGRPDVQAVCAQIKSNGLPEWLHREVEHDLGHAVDQEHPDALAIQKALQIVADYDDYLGLDRVEAVQEAHRDGAFLSEHERRTLSAAGQKRLS